MSTAGVLLHWPGRSEFYCHSFCPPAAPKTQHLKPEVTQDGDNSAAATGKASAAGKDSKAAKGGKAGKDAKGVFQGLTLYRSAIDIFKCFRALCRGIDRGLHRLVKALQQQRGLNVSPFALHSENC